MHIEELITAAQRHMENEGYAADTIYKNQWIWRNHWQKTSTSTGFNQS